MKQFANQTAQAKRAGRLRAFCAGLLLLGLAVLRLPLTAHAAPPLLVDEADVLSDAEEQTLLAHLTEVSNAHDADIVVVIAEDLGGQDSLAYADDYFDYNGYGRGEDRSGALFLHCPSGRDYAFSTRGRAADAISDDALDDLETAVIDYLRADDFPGAYEAFATGCDNYLQYMKEYGVSIADQDIEAHPEDAQYLLNPPEEQRPFFQRLLYNARNNALLAPIIGAIGSLFYGSSKKRKLVSVRRQSGAASYVKAGQSSLRVSRDMFINRTLTKTPIPRHDNNRSSSGGRVGGHTTFHTSSSGASHGGRGGKY